MGGNTSSAGAAGAQRVDHRRCRERREEGCLSWRGGRGTHQHRHVRDVNCAHGALCYAARAYRVVLSTYAPSPFGHTRRSERSGGAAGWAGKRRAVVAHVGREMESSCDEEGAGRRFDF
jgi:hypothetical protein